MESNPNKPKKPLNKYIQFSGIAMQMLVVIYLGNLFGKWLDGKYNNPNELYTKISTLIAVFIAMLTVILQVIKLTKNND